MRASWQMAEAIGSKVVATSSNSCNVSSGFFALNALEIFTQCNKILIQTISVIVLRFGISIKHHQTSTKYQLS